MPAYLDHPAYQELKDKLSGKYTFSFTNEDELIEEFCGYGFSCWDNHNYKYAFYMICSDFIIFIGITSELFDIKGNLIHKDNYNFDEMIFVETQVKKHILVNDVKSLNFLSNSSCYFSSFHSI